ncbi:hypothetical protein GC177_05965 [bacterium]|nr:hypothetical protein [bacterium]
MLPPKAVAIGASTGGPQTLCGIFTQLRGKMPKVPIFITQHMPPIFTTTLAGQISQSFGRTCHEPVEGELITNEGVYLAPGDFHMVANKDEKGGSTLHLNKEPPENFCRPSVDVMLRSLSEVYGRHLLVIILTGMGSDGMLGAEIARKNGSVVVAQSQESCVVYGMPKAVVDAGLADVIISDDQVAPYLLDCFGIKL